ncbi:MAG: AI-2E family transporter [Tissierellaceae bacterium]|nr:AI-2E family transporter [Tissierellaceae bacterium]
MELNSKFMKKAIFLISFAIILMWLLENIVVVVSVLKTFFSIISPFILGLVLAFILNGPMKFLEEKIPWNKGVFRKTSIGVRRGISFLITLILFIGILLLISFIIIPELINTLQDLVNKSTIYIERIQQYVTFFIEDNEQLMEWARFVDFDWEQLRVNSIEFTKNSLISVLESTLNFSISVVSGAINFALAFVFSIYVLFQKEKLIRQMRKLILAISPKKVADKIFYIANLSNRTFSSFLHGQLFEAIILGSLFFIAMTIFRFPYPLMISVTIAVTSIIPIFGAFIGAFIGAFLILVIDFKMAFLFIIMFLIIQQIEGNLIYPHVVGKAAGLPSMWILVAVTVGGSLMGVLGILLFIPLFSIAYTLLGEYINYRLREKKILE